MPCWPWKPFHGGVDSDPDAERHFWGYSPQACFHYSTVALLGQFELHQRTDLVRRLGLPAHHNSYADAELICRAYLQWGDELPQHLDGQFSFAIWNERARTLFACRDHLGTLPFLYYVSGSRFSFAGDMRTMLQEVKPPRVLNPHSLAVLALPGVKPIAGETFHKGIYALPPGALLIAAPSGVRVRRYWRPSIRPDLVPAREEDVFDTARFLVEQSVANRIGSRERIAVLLSGGLDSSAITAVACEYLGQRGHSLVALASVNDPANGAIPDERPWVENLRVFPNLDIHYVDAPGAGPFDGIEDPTRFETSPRINMRYVYDALVGAAESHGAELLLTGNFGEQTISARPKPLLLHLASRLQWRTLAHELRSLSALTQVSPLRHIGSEFLTWAGVRRKASASVWLAPHFRRGIPMTRDQGSSLSVNPQTQAVRDVEKIFRYDGLRSTLPPEHLLSLSQPFHDRNLLEFCLTLSTRFKARDGYSRYLLRRSFQHKLPPEIVWRRGKMAASPDYSARFNAQAKRGLDYVRSIRASDPVRGVVDVEAVTGALLSIIASEIGSVHLREAFTRIPASIQMICFLRQFSEFKV